jgi:hypothetical protein
MSESGTNDQLHDTGGEKLKPPVAKVEDPGAHELGEIPIDYKNPTYINSRIQR